MSQARTIELDWHIYCRIYIFYFMFSQLFEYDALFVVIEFDSSRMVTIMIKMMYLITILHGKYIHNWFGHETNEMNSEMHWNALEMHWNKRDKDLFILCLSSLMWLMDIIVLALTHNKRPRRRHMRLYSDWAYKGILMFSIFHISICIIDFDCWSVC